ncbi:hypothetical protein K8354_15795 [Polaribacter litorisediminis]|uniref:hypothetical protein n=1 Tax=Polaribacter litorisediminis TaxID=1908341 RepID=UPI001CC02555|nr:hypothetical protein [Polaribacter litorisediminis]UAM97740.1 hypothetical protein K8354_15795 [Polaribacter litorisediminis]
MGLINCSECKKEISDKAKSCPSCGNPINQLVEQSKDVGFELLKFPKLPENLKIGKPITNWTGDSAFDGFYEQKENTITEINSGKVKVNLHTHGIEISQGLINFFPIHQTQIISIKKASREEIAKTKKSVLGRAVVGGLILGPIGAIVGGISGLDKVKTENIHYLVINYWEVESKSAKTLLISGVNNLISAFIKRYKVEQIINVKERRKAEDIEITPAILIQNILGLLVIVSMIIYLLFF